LNVSLIIFWNTKKSLTKTLAMKNRRFFTYKSFWRYLFFKRLICTNRAKCFFLFFLDVCLLGLRSKTHSLFAKSEAKTLIKILRIPAQRAERAVTAGGGAAETAQIFSRTQITPGRDESTRS
jgi:hypothetical protein